MTSEGDKALRIEVRDGRHFVFFNDAEIVDDARIQQVWEELEEVATEATTSTRKRLVLNLAGVQTITSAMLGKLVKVNLIVVRGGGKLRLFNPSPQVRKLFDITRLYQVFDIRDGPDEDGPSAGGSVRRTP